MSASTLWIYGVGLIGGSVAAAVRRSAPDTTIVGVGRTQANLDTALERGLIDRIASPEECPEGMVVVAATPQASIAILRNLREQGFKGYATDAVSVKGLFYAEAEEPAWQGRYIPAHPIAGTEHSGAAAAFPDLFDNKLVLLTPPQVADPDAMMAVYTLWQNCGARVHEMDHERHDRLYARVSHMPHILMYALGELLFREHAVDEIAKHSGGGLRGLLRIAASDTGLWSQISKLNRREILSAVTDMKLLLTEYESLLSADVFDQETMVVRLTKTMDFVRKFRNQAGDNR